MDQQETGDSCTDMEYRILPLKMASGIGEKKICFFFCRELCFFTEVLLVLCVSLVHLPLWSWATFIRRVFNVYRCRRWIYRCGVTVRVAKTLKTLLLGKNEIDIFVFYSVILFLLLLMMLVRLLMLLFQSLLPILLLMAVSRIEGTVTIFTITF